MRSFVYTMLLSNEFKGHHLGVILSQGNFLYVERNLAF